MQRADIDLAIAKLCATDMEDVRCEPSLGSTEADNADYSGGRNDLTHGEGSSAMEVQQKGRKYYRRRLGIKEEDAKEACSGTDEAPSIGTLDEKIEPETDGKYLKHTYKVSRRKSKKSLFTAGVFLSLTSLPKFTYLQIHIKVGEKGINRNLNCPLFKALLEVQVKACLYLGKPSIRIQLSK